MRANRKQESARQNLSRAAGAILECFGQRQLKAGALIESWNFRHAVVWEGGFIRDEEVRKAWWELNSQGYAIEYDVGLELTKKGEFLYGESLIEDRVSESGSRVMTVKVSELHELPDLTPPKDAVLLYLFSRAVEGHLPVFHGAVPLSIIRPFSADYDPRQHPIGRQAVDAKQQEWREGKFSNLWVYPDGTSYVISDDYITFYAALEGQPDFLPCFILGVTEDSRIEELQGPIRVPDVRKTLGFPD
jgi:hypothetical protein